MPIVITLGLLVGSVLLGPLGIVAVVVGTTIWVHFDSEKLDYPDTAIEAKVLLLWIIFFPYYLFQRQRLLFAQEVAATVRPRSDLRQSGGGSGAELATAMATQSNGPGAVRVERDCPECGERILATARKCKHCGSAVEPVAEAAVEPTVESGSVHVIAATPMPAAAGAPMSLGASLGRAYTAQADEQEKTASRRVFIGVAAVVVALGGLLWFASNYTGPDLFAGSGSGGADPTPTYAVGELARTPKFGVLVTDVEMPTRVGNMLISSVPADGGKYVAVQWEYQNTSSKPIGMFGQPTLYLEDASGTRYEADLDASSSYAMELDLTEKIFSDLNPGIKVRAAEVFEIAASHLDRPGWMIVIDADETVRLPLFGKPEPAVAVASETSVVEEPVAPQPTPAEEVPALPEFAAYEEAIYDGDLYPADWMTVSESGEWNDQLGKPMDEPDVNFAGKYYIGLHSCGTGCRYYSMTDLSTGQSLNELVARFAAGEERPTMADGREYLTQLAGQADSSLLIAQYHIETVLEPTDECREQAFVLEAEALRAITNVRNGCTEL